MNPRPVILSLTSMHEDGLDRLRRCGQLRMASALDPLTLQTEISDADALVIRTAGVIDAALMNAAPKLRVIGRHGVGYDQVDIPAATERGIQVVYTPGANTEAVAEHALALMIGVSKHFPLHARSLLDGRYNDRTRYVGRELRGRSLGIVGLGRIGSRLAEIARLAFNMRIFYNDIIQPPDNLVARLNAERLTLDALVAQAEYVSLHVPLDQSTRHLVNADRLALFRPDAILVNTCRGPVVDEAAVAAALEAGRLWGYAADVFEIEPPPPDHPLIGRLDCMLTPHSAAQTAESLKNMAIGVADDVVGVLTGAPPRNPVNDPALVAEIRKRLGKDTRPFPT